MKTQDKTHESSISIENSSPWVSFDINYGKSLPEGAEVDYDATALKTTMDTLEIPEAEQAKTNIVMMPPDEGGEGGLYRTDNDGNHEIQVSPKDQETTNRILKHELQHLADTANNVPEGALYNPLLYKAGIKAGEFLQRKSPTIIAMGGAALIAVNRLYINKTGLPLFPDEAIVGSYAAVGLTLGTGVLARIPKVDRWERRARKAEKLDVEPIIQIKTDQA